MQRSCMSFLTNWLVSTRRKPLVIRGARQVGKTWVVRRLAEMSGKQLIEINFERTPQFADFFESNDPSIILRKIAQEFAVTIDPVNTILFLDEIQAKPELFGKLRWFYEDMQELPVIAAGSLLEFYLGTSLIRMPVGRISFMYMEPMSFIEYLQAQKKDQLAELIQTYAWDTEIHPLIHDKILRLFKEYVFIGGMPEAVLTWVTRDSLEDVKQVHQDLIATYRNDFDKYGGRSMTTTLNEVIDEIPVFLGKKFVYSHVDSTSSSIKIKEALNQLCLARVAHKVSATDANGIPLRAEINHKYLKVIFIDVGLCSALLKLKWNDLEDIDNLEMINKGAIAEQVTGQLLRASEALYDEPALYYWVRTQRSSEAELDYIISHYNKVVPLEVKAGTTGTLKSLHLFMKLKKLSTAVRVYSGLPSITEVKVKDSIGDDISYQLRSIPFYMISELQRLLD